MRRIAAVAVVAALVALAFIQAEPAEPDTPGLGFPVPVDPGGAVGEDSVWYCPWVASGAVRDSTFDVATEVNVDATITLPNANPTLEADTLSFQLQGADARSVDTSEIVRRGESPGIVEFGDGPAVATTAMWTDALLSGDRCIQSVPKVWHLVGGTTAEGFTLELRLFNPFPEAAKVSVQAISEFGASPIGGLEGLDVPGRSWLTEDLSRVIPFLDNVTLTVQTETGLVIPALVLSDENDEATWDGIGQSSTWEFPLTSVPGLDPTLVLSNTGDLPATVIIDFFTPDGPVLEATTLLVSPNQPVRLELADFAEPPFGIRVMSNAPVGATIQAAPTGTFPRPEPLPGEEEEVEPPDPNAGGDQTGDQGGGDQQPEQPAAFVGLAATTGTTDPERRWIVPGLGVVPAAETSLWIVNPTGEQATVTITPLGAAATGPDKIIVAPGSQVEIAYGEVTESGTSGVIIDSTVPVDVAVSIASTRGVAFIGGIPVG